VYLLSLSLSINRNLVKGVGVMKDEELKVENIETSL
jgi:hypothetical protein